MNTPITGALLARDKIDRYRSTGAFGKPAYQSYVQMRAMLRSKCGDRVANYFAKPTYDPDAGELRWTAELGGSARSLGDLQGAEFDAVCTAMDEIDAELAKFTAKLREQAQKQGNSQPGGAAAFASLIDQVRQVPLEGDFRFMVGDQPVIAFWGFTDANGASVNPALRPAQPPQVYAAPAEPPAVAPLPVPVEPVKRKRPWWWWLLWLLLALLLLALLLLLPRACTPGGGFDLKRAIPGLAPPDEAASVPELPERRAEGPAGPGGTLPPGGTTEGGGLPQGTAPGVDPALPAASQPGLELPPGDTPRDPKTEPPLPDPKDLPKDDPNKPVPDPKLDPKTDPPLPDPKDAAKDPLAKDDKNKLPKDAKDAKNPKGRTDPPLPPVDPKSMRLPDDPNAAKKMDFLEGQWKAGEGLVDKRTQQPLDLGFKFGKDGQGEVTLKRPDGTVCSGTVQGRVSGGKLGIEGNQSIPCSGGGSYGAPKIECSKESGGQTQCFGINPDGSRYYMGMQRQ